MVASFLFALCWSVTCPETSTLIHRYIADCCRD